jgi:tetratricopeptide (TPR) repeat protein
MKPNALSSIARRQRPDTARHPLGIGVTIRPATAMSSAQPCGFAARRDRKLPFWETRFATGGFRATIFLSTFECRVMRNQRPIRSLTAMALGLLLLFGAPAAGHGDESNAAKAQALVNAAINMTDSDKAVKLLWQATDMDPTLDEAYIYLGLFYNSRSDFAKVVEVYKRYLKYRPDQISAYLNIGEAYMSFTPPKYSEALPYYRKAYKLDPANGFAALRIGEILAQQGSRDEAIRFLKQATADATKNPGAADEARKVLSQMGAS